MLQARETMIFVDTGALYAFAVASDERHGEARAWLRKNQVPLITTDYVVDELLTLLRARRRSELAVWLGTLLFTETLANLHYVTEDDVLAAWQVYRTYADKEWSFTDCVSKVVVEKHYITRAFAFDHHFHQFGSVAVVP